MRVCSECAASKEDDKYYKTKGQCKECILKRRGSIIRIRSCVACGGAKPHTSFPLRRRVCLVCLGLAEDVPDVEPEPEPEPEPQPVPAEDGGFPFPKLRVLLSDIHRRSALLNKRRFHDKQYQNDLDIDYCRGMWESQKGRCAMSGLPMTSVNGGSMRANMHNVSVDRIDSFQNYKKGNVQLVCMAVNKMKSTFSSAEFVSIARNVTRHSTGQVNACVGTA